MIERRLDTVDRFILVEHLIGIPTVRIAIQLQANVVTVRAVPRFQFLFVGPRRRPIAACRNRRVRRQCVSRCVLQINVLGNDTDNIAWLEDQHIDDRIDGDLWHTSERCRRASYAVAVRWTARRAAVVCVVVAIAVVCGVMMMMIASVHCDIDGRFDAMRHLKGHLESGRKCAIDTFVDAAGQRLHLHNVAHVHRGGMHKV